VTVHPDPDAMALGVFVRVIPGWKLVTAVSRALPPLGMNCEPVLVQPPPITLPDLHMNGPEPISALFGLATAS